MMGRLALALAFLALAAAAGGVVLLGNKLIQLTRRVEALENRPLPAPPPPPPPPAAPKEPDPNDPTARLELERQKIRALADRENQLQFEGLAKKLELDADLEKDVREAFADEFAYYADGVIRAIDALRSTDPKDQGNLMTSPEFRKGLEERIAATDQKVRDLLTMFKFEVFEKWRREMRKERYELD